MEKYEVLRLLGKGSFGAVYVARLKSDSSLHVMKKINIHNLPDKERIAAEQEAEVLQQFHHPGIVPLEDSFIYKNRQLCIVMEFCEGGDLSKKVEQRAGRKQYFTENEILDWFLQICLALQYIHEKRFLHRDIKTQNIFLTKDNQVRLGDFGIARALEGTMELAHTTIGTPYYMSPELFRNQPYNYKSDIWSLGCVLYELCALRHAFEARDMDGLVQKILRANYPPLPSGYSKDIQGVVRSCLNPTPNSRPSVESILQLGFLRKKMASYLSQKLGDNSLGGLEEIGNHERGLAQKQLLRQAEYFGVDVRPPQQKQIPVASLPAKQQQSSYQYNPKSDSPPPPAHPQHPQPAARAPPQSYGNPQPQRAGPSSLIPSGQPQQQPQSQMQSVQQQRAEAMAREKKRRAEELLEREQRAKERAEAALKKLQEERMWRVREAQLRRERHLRRLKQAQEQNNGHEWRANLARAQEDARRRDSRHSKFGEAVRGGGGGGSYADGPRVGRGDLERRENERQLREFEENLKYKEFGPQAAGRAQGVKGYQQRRPQGGVGVDLPVYMNPPPYKQSPYGLEKVPAYNPVIAQNAQVISSQPASPWRGRHGPQPKFISFETESRGVAMVEEEAGLVAPNKKPRESYFHAPAPVVDDEDIPFEEWLENKRAELDLAEAEVAKRTLTVQMLQMTLGRAPPE